jgi:hypothetical protein
MSFLKLISLAVSAREYHVSVSSNDRNDGSTDLLIKNNRLSNVVRGMWMDWMAQETTINCNLF